jgi:hypothetical protein
VFKVASARVSLMITGRFWLGTSKVHRLSCVYVVYCAIDERRADPSDHFLNRLRHHLHAVLVHIIGVAMPGCWCSLLAVGFTDFLLLAAMMSGNEVRSP